LVQDNFTTWTESDASGRISKTASRVTWTNLNRTDTNTYIYKNKAGTLQNFIRYFTLRITAIQSASQTIREGVIFVSEHLDDYTDVNAGGYESFGLILRSANSTTTYSLIPWETYNTTGYAVSLGNNLLNVGTTYYCKIVKSGTSWMLYVYTDPAFSIPEPDYGAGGKGLVLHGNWNLQYMMIAQSINLANSVTISGYLENLKDSLIEDGTPQNLKAKFVVRKAGSQDLKAEAFIAPTGTADLDAKFIVRKSGSVDLHAKFVLKQGIGDLEAEFIVRRTATKEIPCKTTIRQSATYNIPAEFIVRHTATKDLISTFTIRYGVSNLPSKFIVRHSTSSTRFAKFRVEPVNRWATWTKKSNPVWDSGDYSWSSTTPDNFCVLRDPETSLPVKHDGKYWAVYNTPSASPQKGIGICYSYNLLNWVDSGYDEIVPSGGAGAWDYQIAVADFLYMHDQPSSTHDFWIFYVGADIAGNQNKIGVSRSNNLTSWTKYGIIAAFIPAWAPNSNGLEDFRILKASNGDWYAAYEANKQRNMVAIGTAKTTQALPLTGWVDTGQAFSNTYGADTFCANPSLIKRIEGVEVIYYLLYEWLYNGDVSSRAYEAYVREQDFHVANAWIQRPAQPAYRATEGWEGNNTIPNGFIISDVNKTLVISYYTGDQGAADKKIGFAYRTLPGTVGGDTNLFAKFIVTHWRDLKAEFKVRHSAINDLSATFHVGQDSRDLLVEAIIRHSTSKDLEAFVVIRHSASKDIPAELIVIHWRDLKAVFSVYSSGSLDLKAVFRLRQENLELPAEVIIRHSASLDLAAESIIRQTTSKELRVIFVIRHSQFIRRRIYCKFKVRHSSVLDLRSVFKVSQATLVKDLEAEFFVNQFNASLNLGAEFYIRPDMLDIKTFTIEEPVKRGRNWLR